MTKDFKAKVISGRLQIIESKEFKDHIQKLEGRAIVLKVEDDEKRTEKQNKALHLYLTLVSKALNDAGYTVEQVIKLFTIELYFTPEIVKEGIWRTIQKAVLKKHSTTELKKREEIDKVWELMNRFLGEKLKIESIPFPFECKSCGGLSRHYKGCPDVY